MLSSKCVLNTHCNTWLLMIQLSSFDKQIIYLVANKITKPDLCKAKHKLSRLSSFVTVCRRNILMPPVERLKAPQHSITAPPFLHADALRFLLLVLRWDVLLLSSLINYHLLRWDWIIQVKRNLNTLLSDVFFKRQFFSWTHILQ